MNLYNTLTKKVEVFTPISTGKVNMFVCGPTVYDYIHIGNAKTLVQMDIIVRSLRYLGYDVTYLQNITDIDDKIIIRAKEAGTGWKELTDKYTAAYHEDVAKLGIESVNTYARATDHIPDIITQVQQLIHKGFAYTIDDGIYFEVAKFRDYGKLSGRQKIQEDDAQTRIDENMSKRGWNDFCLWKFSKPSEPVWEAPFGKGRPGWHIEDTAITEHYFGPQYDVHGGAVDLIFPHHEAEITQMEAASGKSPLVRHWLHAGFMNISGTRMGKSKGNFTTARAVFEKGYSTNAIRVFFAQAHYRSPLDFSWDNLDAAVNRLHRWQATMDLRWQENNASDNSFSARQYLDQIKVALENDIDTPAAFRTIEQAMDKLQALHLNKTSMEQLATEINNIFGIDLLMGREDVSQEQKDLLLERQQARDTKDFEASDKLRNKLRQQGIDVRDTSNGQIWSRINS